MTELAATIGPWVAILALLLGIANTINSWVSRPGRELKSEVEKNHEKVNKRIGDLGEDTDAAIAVLDQRITSESQANYERFKEHDRRIQAVESEIKHTPTSKDMNDLQQAVTKLETQMPLLAETMKGLTQSIRTIDAHLLESKK